MVPLVAVLVYLQHHAYDHYGFCVCVLYLHYLHKCTRTSVLESSFTDACCIRVVLERIVRLVRSFCTPVVVLLEARGCKQRAA